MRGNYFTQTIKHAQVSITGGAAIKCQQREKFENQKRRHHGEIQGPFHRDTEPVVDMKKKRLIAYCLERVG